jgi:N-acetyl-anhydromuramyl-L-alanine amidase AmpD
MRKDSGTGVSVHYVIDRNGDIYQLFDEKYFAYHAGANFRNISKISFGI